MRYGADYPNPGYEAKNNGKSAPNAPYAPYAPIAYCLLPIAYCLLPIATPYSLMKTSLAKYWTLNYINRLGQHQTKPIEKAKEFISAQALTLSTGEDTIDQALISRLWERYHSQDEDLELAEVCLRCLVSQQIKEVCYQLVEQFGQQHNFTMDDLMPLVLDRYHEGDQGHKLDENKSLITYTLKTFDPDKSSLFAWTKRLVKTNKEVKRFLLYYGIEQVTDWLLLKQTTPGKLHRIISEFHQLTAQEINHYRELLESYQRIYVSQLQAERNQINQQRQQQGLGKLTTPYPIPTKEQLQLIGKLSPEAVLTELQTLAQLIRDYKRNHGRNVPTQALGKFEHQLAADDTSNNQEENEVLAAYDQLLQDCLTTAIQDVIQNRVTYLSRQQKPKHQQFLEALDLFHCHHVTMTKIAAQIGFTAQYQVSRLLDLKAFRADIARRTSVRLHHQLVELGQAYASAQEVKELDKRISQFVEEAINQIMTAARKETFVKNQYKLSSNFSRTLCELLNKGVGSRESGIGNRESGEEKGSRE
ncbi:MULTISPECIES: hypothetical protein [Moorena]|uniref:hypothetical protein n=1 Tax=Moorena TaxID=1155738 RepID=UPI000316DA53|nr:MULTISPECIES: hypothetical protein [Moorena]NER87632.1 hypothetical protein [Moorena sp. SIO3A2]